MSILDIARSYVGVKEGTAEHRAIIDKYNTISPLPRGYAVRYTDAWCATFVSTCALLAGIKNFPYECGCQEMYNHFKTTKDRNFTPAPGTPIFYDWNGDRHTEHVGIVESVSGGQITVIEGNHNDAVGRRTIAVGDPCIYGYGIIEEETMSTKETIWKALISWIKNPVGVAGLMGNLRAESRYCPNNLQDRFNTSFGLSDEAYTAGVNDGTYTNFINDGAGYGLAQWTWWSRKKGLLDRAKERRVSIDDLHLQLDYIEWEMKNNYPSIFETLKSTESVREASNAVLFAYEAPGDQGQAVQDLRAAYSEEAFAEFAGTEPCTLKKGMTGEDVADLQENLKKLGFCGCDAYWPGSRFVDGDFQGATERCVRAFQHYEISKGNQIGTDGKPDGEFGPLSRAVLEQELAETNFDKFDFTAEDVIAGGIETGEIYKANGYKWASAEVAPWWQPWAHDSSCDRGAAEAFWRAGGKGKGLCLGNRDAERIAARLIELGAAQVADPAAIKAGDVVFLNSWHIFLAASGRDANGNYQRIDFGSTDRMKHGQPHIEPITDVRLILRPPYENAQIEPQTSETAEDGKFFRVQAGAFLFKENAMKQVDALKEAGFDAVIIED